MTLIIILTKTSVNYGYPDKDAFLKTQKGVKTFSFFAPSV